MKIGKYEKEILTEIMDKMGGGVIPHDKIKIGLEQALRIGFECGRSYEAGLRDGRSLAKKTLGMRPQ